MIPNKFSIQSKSQNIDGLTSIAFLSFSSSPPTIPERKSCECWNKHIEVFTRSSVKIICISTAVWNQLMKEIWLQHATNLPTDILLLAVLV